MIESMALKDEDWTCNCEGCQNIRLILKEHPEPWHMRDDNAVLDANDNLVMPGSHLARYVFRKFMEMIEESKA